MWNFPLFLTGSRYLAVLQDGLGEAGEVGDLPQLLHPRVLADCSWWPGDGPTLTGDWSWGPRTQARVERTLHYTAATDCRNADIICCQKLGPRKQPYLYLIVFKCLYALDDTDVAL